MQMVCQGKMGSGKEVDTKPVYELRVSSIQIRQADDSPEVIVKYSIVTYKHGIKPSPKQLQKNCTEEILELGNVMDKMLPLAVDSMWLSSEWQKLGVVQKVSKLKGSTISVEIHVDFGRGEQKLTWKVTESIDLEAVNAIFNQCIATVLPHLEEYELIQNADEVDGDGEV